MEAAKQRPTTLVAAPVSNEYAEKQAAVLKLVTAYRSRGHLGASLDPLGMTPKPEAPDLDLPFHGLSNADLDTEFTTHSLAGAPRMVLRGGSVAPGDRPFVTPEDFLQFAWFRDALRAVLGDPRVRLVNNCKANLDGWVKWLDRTPGQLGSKPMVIYNAIDFKALGEPDPKRVDKLRSALKIPKGVRVVGGVGSGAAGGTASGGGVAASDARSLTRPAPR